MGWKIGVIGPRWRKPWVSLMLELFSRIQMLKTLVGSQCKASSTCPGPAVDLGWFFSKPGIGHGFLIFPHLVQATAIWKCLSDDLAAYCPRDPQHMWTHIVDKVLIWKALLDRKYSVSGLISILKKICWQLLELSRRKSFLVGRKWPQSSDCQNVTVKVCFLYKFSIVRLVKLYYCEWKHSDELFDD